MGKFQAENFERPALHGFHACGRPNTAPELPGLPPGPAIFIMAAISMLLWGLLFEAVHFLWTRLF
jgi:hypothetical protein